jgi:hypothetical protein
MTSAFTDPPDTRVITIRRASGTIVVRPAPHREPPFDDEVDSGCTSVGPYDQPLPFDRPPGRRRLVPSPVSPLRAALPDPAQWARRLLIGVIETAGGRRPLNQLATLLSPGVANGLRTDFELAALRGKPHWTHAASVRSVRSSEPVENVAELSATVRAGERVHAVALRLEVRHGRWCCTRLVLG